MHWDAELYIVEYQYSGLSVAGPILLALVSLGSLVK
jgi:hypothetical protein